MSQREEYELLAEVIRLREALREIQVIATGWDIHGRDRIAEIARLARIPNFVEPFRLSL